MNILLTGATGFIGYHICNRLSLDGNTVICIVRDTSDISQLSILENVLIIRYCKYEDIYSGLIDYTIDVFIHCAGVFYTKHDTNNIENLLESNLVFSTIITDAAVKAGCRKIINTSSYWEAYNGKPRNPVNLYAATKLAFESILKYYSRSMGCDVTTLIIYDTYGYGDQRRKILNILRDMKDGESIDMSEGNQKISLVYVDDVVKAYSSLVYIKNRRGTLKKYDIIADELTTLKSNVEVFLKLSKKKIVINWGKRPSEKDTIFDAREINGRPPGWEPDIDIVDGMKMFLGEKRDKI